METETIVWLGIGIFIWIVLMALFAESELSRELKYEYHEHGFNPITMFRDTYDEITNLRFVFRVLASIGITIFIMFVAFVIWIASGLIFKSLIFKKEEK